MISAETVGWCAAGLMVATFSCRRAGPMRGLAACTNVAFMLYGCMADLHPVVALHALLLPINLWRWMECCHSEARNPSQSRKPSPSAMPLMHRQAGHKRRTKPVS